MGYILSKINTPGQLIEDKSKYKNLYYFESFKTKYYFKTRMKIIRFFSKFRKFIYLAIKISVCEVTHKFNFIDFDTTDPQF